MEPLYRFEARFAGVPLDVVNFSGERGRDVVAWRPARGDGAQLSDRGRRERRDTLTVQIVHRGGHDDPAARRDALLELNGSGESRMFVHPIEGFWKAKLAGFSNALGAGSDVWTMELVEDTPATRETTAREIAASFETVIVLADEVDKAAAEMERAGEDGMPSSAEARQLAASWDDAVPSQLSIDEQARQLEAFQAAQDLVGRALEVRNTAASYRAYLAHLELRGEMWRYAEAVRRAAPRAFDLEILVPLPLRVLCTRLYGAAEAAARMAEALELNAIKTPLRIGAGTKLRMPARSRYV